MEGHAKKVERYCVLQQLHKVGIPCIDDHQFKEEEIGSVGELSEVCAQIVFKFMYLARTGRLDILWSMSEKACPCHHKMDESMRQASSSFDFSHSSHR